MCDLIVRGMAHPEHARDLTHDLAPGAGRCGRVQLVVEQGQWHVGRRYCVQLQRLKLERN